MNDKQLKEAEELYQSWSDAQLVRATAVERQDYQPAALDLMMRELSRRGVSHSERQNLEEDGARQVEVERKRLTGVRGVLLLFAINVMLSSLLSVLFGLEYCLDSESGLFVLCGALDLIWAGYGFYVFYLLIRERPAAPQHAQRFLFLGFLLSVLVVLVALRVTHRLDLSPLGNIGTLVWMVYLSSSKRVANTYGQRQDKTESGQGNPVNTA